ncbi:MAG: S8 family serine peptidase [Candidatus Aminicenantes bacterium]|nr:S8 family serine peptidase [Candidatus Aminicenantes bacterium]NIM79081.1 S8 family serine peptidase [Candidatus Aminicenantes bacterium]NIN18360.1 S8 family serine peptidase [Candidatus Aminicenantes bacterium]NIN42247.1 S8 family serine peptidase [Candidatus Aminicenantes bacterium]NIN85013.1 S8 family serine peptidase [Candidatus Aminicenantes bacterium]
MKRKLFLTMVIGFFFLLFATLGFGESWILNPKNDNLLADLEAKVNQAGGTLVMTLDEVGIAVAEFATREDAESLEVHGIEVMPDLYVDWHGSEVPNEYVDSDTLEMAAPEATWYYRQWHIPVIEANKAWDAGEFGAGVRVAVVDSGIWYPHPDLFTNIDFASSKSFVPGVPDFIDIDGHGTHVAGIIAANGTLRAKGIAPQATLIAIKSAEGGGGYMSWIIAGINHAVAVDADIINVSMGNLLSKSGYYPYYTARDVAMVCRMYTKTITRAMAEGSLMVFSAGNNAWNLDHAWELIHVPGECGNGLSVSATGPIGLQDFDRLASYSNSGNSLVWVAAPGGDFVLLPTPGWWYDMVYSTYIGGWAWMAGTSQAAPMVCGVAALILSKHGPMSPGELKNYIANTADDLGKPGHDPSYGRGRVNAYRAVTE